jgi:hypothetical protein
MFNIDRNFLISIKNEFQLSNILESWKDVSRDVIIHNIEDCENRVLMIERSQK